VNFQNHLKQYGYFNHIEVNFYYKARHEHRLSKTIQNHLETLENQ